MRILLLTHYYDPETGPPQLRWSSLVREFVRAGHQVDVVAPPPHYPLGRLLDTYDGEGAGSTEQGRHGETVHRVRFRPTSGRIGSILFDQLTSAVSSVVTVLRQRELAPDVIVATAPALPTLMAGWVLARTLRRPLLLEVRDAWPDLLAVVDRWEGGENRRHPQVKRAVAHLAARFITLMQRSADYVVTTTSTFAEVLQGRGVANVDVVRNTAHPLPNYAEHQNRQPDGQLRIVYVGTVGRAQGLETAVRALRIVQDAGIDVAMRVIGTGAGKNRVQQTAEALGVPVTVRGAQSRDQIHLHYRWADTFLIMLREWPALRMTVPSKLYEALQLGIHVSASVDGEAARIVTSTGAGFATPPGDAEALAAEWIALAKKLPVTPDQPQMRAWVREHAEESRVASNYLQILRALAAAHR